TCSQFLNWAPRPRCCRSFHCSTEVASSRLVLAVPLQNTSSSCSRKTTCAGTHWVNSWHWLSRSNTWRRLPTTLVHRFWPTRWMLARGCTLKKVAHRHVKWANSITVVHTSTLPCTGQNPSQSRPKTLILQQPSNQWLKNCAPTKKQFLTHSTKFRARKSPSTVTTTRTTT